MDCPLRFFPTSLVIALAAIFFASPTAAQEQPEYRCDECRDIREHPEDARNFSVNLIFGAGSFLGFGDTEFTLTDRFGNSVNVDINADYIRQSSDWHTLGEILRKDLLLRLIDDLLIKDMIIQILLTFPNGDSSVFKLYTSKLNPAGGLPVPAHESDSSGTGTSGGTGGSSGVEESWGDRRERWAEEEEAYGFPVCWPDFSQPNETTTVCNPWP